MSEVIQSDLGVAKQCANQLKTACDSIVKTKTVSRDNQTTLTGNTQAHEAINELQATSANIARVVNQSIKQLQTVATNFEADDQLLSRQFFK